MTEKYIIDAYAWIEYLIGSESGVKVNSVLTEEENEICTCAVTVAEVISKAAREGRNVETVYDILTNNSSIIDVDEKISKETGVLHAQMRKTRKDFGLADAYVLAIAKKTKSKILTGDPHFEGIENAIVITSR